MDSTVAFIHSTGLGPFMWTPYRAVAPSGGIALPFNLGYEPGQEVSPPRRVRLSDDVDHLAARLPADRPVHLVAHSWGATIALALASCGRLQVASLWLYEPVLFGALVRHRDELDTDTGRDLDAVVAGFQDIADITQASEDWLRRFIDYWNGPGAWHQMSEKARDAMRRVAWKMVQEVKSTFEDTETFDAFRTEVPTTLVVGERTQRPARAMARQLHAVLPTSSLQLVAGLRHMSVLDRADVLAPMLAEHLRVHQR